MSEQTPNIFSITAVDPAEQPLADAATAAMNAMALDTNQGRSLIIGANAFRDHARNAQMRGYFARLYEEALASAFTWRESSDHDLADAMASTWALAPPRRPLAFCPNCEDELPPEERDHGMCPDCARDLRAAGWVPAAEVYPNDNSPALGSRKEEG